jgi:molybdenum cofactor synthesis domain-containing protein
MPSESAKEFNAAVITVSDKAFRGERKDQSGPTARQLLEKAGFNVERIELVSDDYEALRKLLLELSEAGSIDLIVTTGGTGFGPRDLTPEATLDMIERRADGLTELMRISSLEKTPLASLSRAVCGIRKRTLIINLPGSPSAVKENLKAVLPVLDHALALLSGSEPH